LSLAILGGLTTAAILFLRDRDARGGEGTAKVITPSEAEKLGRPDTDTLIVPPDVFSSLGLVVKTAEAPTRRPRLTGLNGTLALDTNRMVRIHTRLPGEVVAIGTTDDPNSMGAVQDGVSTRPLRAGDKVREDQLLAVVWSKDLGEKKSELVDTVSRLKLDREVFERLRELARTSAAPERSVREAERAVENDLINISRIKRTLRSWRLSEKEIDAVEAEANQLIGPVGGRPGDQADWARVEIRVPKDGIKERFILEKNISIGDIIDTNADLFKIGDLSRLNVWVHVYEEDLPAILKLPRPIPWTIQLPSRPDAVFPGHLEQIGAVIDPAQHTALVSGQVDNSKGELRVGQFVTATIELSPAADEVEVPTGAVVEDGRQSILFVHPNPNEQGRFQRRRVEVVRRFHDFIYLQKSEAIRPGERVVAAGAVLLNDALNNLPVKP